MIGAYTPVAIIIGGAVAALAAYSYIKLGVYYKDEGATYSYFKRTFPSSPFISHSVVVGFTTGAARLIAVKQAKAFLGLDIPDTGHLIQMLEYLSTHWENFYPHVLPVTVVTLLTGLIYQYRCPNKHVMIIALRAGSIATLLFNHTCQQRNGDRIIFFAYRVIIFYVVRNERHE